MMVYRIESDKICPGRKQATPKSNNIEDLGLSIDYIVDFENFESIRHEKSFVEAESHSFSTRDSASSAWQEDVSDIFCHPRATIKVPKTQTVQHMNFIIFSTYPYCCVNEDTLKVARF